MRHDQRMLSQIKSAARSAIKMVRSLVSALIVEAPGGRRDDGRRYASLF
jgi:hypothetical protein